MSTPTPVPSIPIPATDPKSSKPKRVDLRKLFLNHQEQMAAELRRFRCDIEHPTQKGDGSERCWRQMLATYFPKRYCVEGARVVDCEGNLSDQIDVVIFDQQYTPFLFNEEGIFYVPAESVYAVLEVKQELTKEYVEYAGLKAASVRRLRRTSAKIPHAGGTFKPKPLHRISAGIVTLDSAWNPPLGHAFETALTGLSDEQRLEFGCVLNGGSFLCRYDDAGNPTIRISAEQDALITFFLRLVAELQQFGTAPAIDLAEWERPLSLEWVPLTGMPADSLTKS